MRKICFQSSIKKPGRYSSVVNFATYFNISPSRACVCVRVRACELFFFCVQIIFLFRWVAVQYFQTFLKSQIQHQDALKGSPSG